MRPTGVSDAVAQIRLELFQDETRKMHVFRHLNWISIFPHEHQILRRPPIYIIKCKKKVINFDLMCNKNWWLVIIIDLINRFPHISFIFLGSRMYLDIPPS